MMSPSTRRDRLIDPPTGRGRGAASVLRAADTDTTDVRLSLRADAHSQARQIAIDHQIAMHDVLAAIVEGALDPHVGIVRTGLHRGWWSETTADLVDHTESVPWWANAVAGSGTEPPAGAGLYDWGDVIILSHISRSFGASDRHHITLVASILNRISSDLGEPTEAR